jgi:MFS transporter, DHA1 family, multidrug resistance protein
MVYARPMNLRPVVILLYFFLALQPLSTDLYLPSLPTIASDLAAPASRVQLTLSLFLAGFAICQLIVGPITDRFGRLIGVFGGLILYLAAAITCATAPDIDYLIVGRVMQGLAVGAVVVSARSVFRDSFEPEEGARVLAKVYSWIGIVPFFAPIVGSLLLAVSGWRSAFVLFAVNAGLLAIFTYFIMKETNRFKNPKALDVGPLFRNYWMVFKNGTFQSFTAASGASFSGLFCFLSGSSFVLIDLMKLTPMLFSIGFSCVCLGYMLGARLAARSLPRNGIGKTARIATRFTLTGGLSLLALAILSQQPSLSFLKHPVAILAPTFVYLIGHGMLQPCSQSGAIAPFPKNAGAASAMMGFLMNLMAAVVGFLLSQASDGTSVPMASGVAICACLAIFFSHRFIK